MANPAGNPQNLTPWQPGQSGNPKGRPPERPIAKELKRLADEMITMKVTRADGEKETVEVTRLQALAFQAWQRAMAGDYRWGRELLDRIDGKTIDKVIVTDDSEDREQKQRTFERIFGDPVLLKQAVALAESLETEPLPVPAPPDEQQE